MIRIEITSYLPQFAKDIRQTVFITEQGFVNEFDDTDEKAWHLVVYDDNSPIACCRFFKGDGANEFIIGRLAVLKEHRGKQLGALMVKEAEKYIRSLGGEKLSLSSQVRAKGFYEKQGFTASGDIYYDEYCEHIHMEKML
ncbi:MULTISPECIES: GNAT family N-acetyltransferase [unclassified Ruminococcus]|uniref:GNAT family N-acetyltransferase n=1 Tax=unclassified Ruminococcus TaxID=2608920 RepID=UPI00210D1B95|nr:MULTISPECIES: GNAT family N-acetyltransferase [unclassified Ruminococcus]MCQ4022608.1 GNAT family N-acetyltransferase [Ruminococcus sp. zg-924]MCQ4114848.1 GNAT family N-acetyltransferase [Ruminococcus sp. zg-921]